MLFRICVVYVRYQVEGPKSGLHCNGQGVWHRVVGDGIVRHFEKGGHRSATRISLASPSDPDQSALKKHAKGI